MPSRVADILMAEAAGLGRAREQQGAIWGGAIQNIGAQVADVFSPEQQMRRLQIEGIKRAQAGQQRAQQVLAQFPRNEDGTFDAGSLVQRLSGAGVPLEETERLSKSVDGINGVIRQSNQDRQDRIADAAHTILSTHKGQPISSDVVHMTTEALRGNVLHTDDINKFTQLLGQHPDDDLTPLLTQIRDSAPKYQKTKEVPRGGTLVREATGAVVATGQAPAETQVDLAKRAVAGDKDAQAALTQLKPPTVGMTEIDLAKQAAAGDPAAKAVLERLKPPKAPTTSELALRASQGDEQAAAAVKLLKPEHAAADPQSAQTQEKLEQEYRGVLQREMSSRSGGLGLEDQKVNQANHLLALLDQYEGKNMPSQIQAELALGLARLTSPSGQVGIELEKEFNQRTAEGGLSKAIAWITGDPTLVNAAPEKLREMFRDSITRQGEVAVDNREAYFKAMRAMAPTDLATDRRSRLEQGMGLNPLRTSKGQQPQKGATMQKFGATYQWDGTRWVKQR